jgi:hypothetical protein
MVLRNVGTLCYNPEDLNLDLHRRENLKPLSITFDVETSSRHVEDHKR